MIKKRWGFAILAVVILVIGGFYYWNQTRSAAQETGQVGQGTVEIMGESAEKSLITIQPASTIGGDVRASGQIELVSQQQVSLQVGGTVQDMHVKAGDVVTSGTQLLSLDTAALEQAVMRANLAVEAQQITVAQFSEEQDSAEIAAAQAELAEAQETLADVMAGPSDEEIAAARSNLSSAWSSYNELLADPSDNELAQLSADLRKAEVVVAEAQRAYDNIKWVGNAGSTAESASLQDATIDYERAKAAYNESVEPAKQSSIQAALSTAQDAQVRLDNLLASPTKAEIANAQAGVANAEVRLAELLAGSSGGEHRSAEISLDQAVIDLHTAYSDLEAANVVAPIDGVILEINATKGEYLSQNSAVATVADVNALELTINVAEVDIMQVALEQHVEVTIDAFIGQVFVGVVDQIAPISDAASGVVNYPVTIRLTDVTDQGIRPGMTAVATLVNPNETRPDLWLVPDNAIESNGAATFVTVTRGEQTLAIDVTPLDLRNEWRMVQSADLQIGDQVLGSVASFVDEGNPFGGGPGGGGDGDGGEGE